MNKSRVTESWQKFMFLLNVHAWFDTKTRLENYFNPFLLLSFFVLSISLDEFLAKL